LLFFNFLRFFKNYLTLGCCTDNLEYRLGQITSLQYNNSNFRIRFITSMFLGLKNRIFVPGRIEKRQELNCLILSINRQQ